MVLKSLKSDPPGTFYLIDLQPDCLSKSKRSFFLPNSQKNDVQIFDRWSGYKIVKQNVPEGSDFSDVNTMHM